MPNLSNIDLVLNSKINVGEIKRLKNSIQYDKMHTSRVITSINKRTVKLITG